MLEIIWAMQESRLITEFGIFFIVHDTRLEKVMDLSRLEPETATLSR